MLVLQREEAQCLDRNASKYELMQWCTELAQYAITSKTLHFCCLVLPILLVHC